MTDQIPLVDYLRLGANPHLVAQKCASCGACYFDRRNACSHCFSTSFDEAEVATEGEVRAFTIVHLASPGVQVPYVSAIVDCDGTNVRANIINTPSEPDHVSLGMRVRLATYSMGRDSAGTEGIGFGFEPV